MIRFGVLGDLQVVDEDGSDCTPRGLRQRRLLAGLVLRRDRVVPVDVLGEIVWGTVDPPNDAAALQSLVFRLRRAVAGLDLQHRGAGYTLHCDDAAVDAVRFERLIWDASARRDRPEIAIAAIDDALELWRGEPYHDLVEFDEALVEIERLQELRDRAVEDRFELLVRLGQAADVLADLEAFTARHPLRERPRRVLMDALAGAGRRAEALRVYDSYRRLLADELGVSASPALRARHEELLADDDSVSARATVAPSRARTPLRRPTSSLIGREALLDDVVERAASNRLVTLIGPGGVGKTRLAIAAGHRLTVSFPDGVVFCDMTSAGAGAHQARGDAHGTAPTSVVGAFIAALGIETRTGQDDLHRLSDVVRHERLLLVVDNCEHVLDDAATVIEHVLTMTEHVVIVVTSRERLAVEGEQVMTIPPLDCSIGEAPSPAMQLLVERARAVTTFDPDDDDLALLGALCVRLDGLPLAIELAAARLQTLSVTEVVAGLDRNLSVLRGGRRTVERHRSVEAALRWSYDLLGGAERRALQAAAMFSATFDADDVAAVMGLDPGETRELLSALVEQSMAHREAQRVYLLDIVRQFARENTGADERSGLAPRFATRMRAIGAQLSADLRTAPDAAPIDEFVRRRSDFRVALSTAIDAGDADLALGISVGVRELSLNSLSADLMRWGADAAAIGDRLDHPLTADSYGIAAMAAWERADLDEMRRLLACADEVVTRLGLGDRYLVLGSLGVEALAHGRLADALEFISRGLVCADAVNDPLRQADGRATLAICLSYAHDPSAITVAEQLVQDLGDGPGAVTKAWCWYALGECLLDTEPMLARHHLERSVQFARDGGSSFVEGVAGASLASTHVRYGDAAAAVLLYRDLLPLWLRAGVRAPFWTAMRSVTDLLARAGEHRSAARVLGAVTAPGAGSTVFGDDAVRLAAVQSELIEQLGLDVFTTSYDSGAALDDAAAAREATAAFDRIS